MWFDYDTLQKSRDRFLRQIPSIQSLSIHQFSLFRHWCDQNDQLKYEWTYHDGEKFGIEDIKDTHFQLNIQWMKEFHGSHGGDWTARIHVIPQVRIEPNHLTPVCV